MDNENIAEYLRNLNDIHNDHLKKHNPTVQIFDQIVATIREHKTIGTIPIAQLPKSRGCLYYYAGNFYSPIALDGSEVSIVNSQINRFKKTYKDIIDRDRKRPDYKPWLELIGNG